MELANGAPSVRIWIVGTNRILGVHQRDATFDELPANIRQAWKRKGEPWGYRLYGDFKVCPLTPDRQGWMQMVRVESGKHLRLDVD